MADLWFSDCAVAEEVTLEAHRSRGLLHRVFERVAGLGTIRIIANPEPATGTLLALGLAVLGLRRRRR